MSKENLLLPKTAFSMKANLAVKEPAILEQWDKNELFQSWTNIQKSQQVNI